MTSVVAKDLSSQLVDSETWNGEATEKMASNTTHDPTFQQSASYSQDNKVPQSHMFFISRDCFPNFNISVSLKKGLGRLKRCDIQHGQKRPDFQKTLYAPICCGSVLFFIWGFAYGLLDTMNNHVRKLMDLSRAVSALLAVAYYAAYPVAVFAIAGPLIKRCGYRVTFLTGLFIFAV